MSLNPVVVSHNWNCTRPEKDGFSLELTGTIKCIQEVQAREYNPNGIGEPRFWKNSNDPVMNIRIGLANPDGDLKTITFAKAGAEQRKRRKPSLHMQLFDLTGGKGMATLVGKTIHIWTWPQNPETGAPWGQGNPRLFGVELVQGNYELNDELPEEYTVPRLLCNDAVSGGQPVPTAPQYMQQPQVPQYSQPMPQYQQPVYQQPVYQAPQYAPMPTQTPQQYMQQQPAPQPVQQVAPQGMDPAVAQAMQAVNQPALDPNGDIIPF